MAGEGKQLPPHLYVYECMEGLDIKPDNHLGYGTEQQPIELEHLLPWIDKVKTI